MNLEVGKYYKTRNGDKVFLRETKEEGCAGFGEPYGLYLPDGKFGYMEKGRHCCACPDLDIIAEWSDTPEVGTLKEIGAQVGDVVREAHFPSKKVIAYHDGEPEPWVLECQETKEIDYWAGDYAGWRIISRSQDQTGPVRTVTRREIVTGVYGKVVVKDFFEAPHGYGLEAHMPTPF